MLGAEPDASNRNPTIERMVAILLELERAPSGLGLKRLVEQSGVTRSTVYRILNSLAAHGLVRQLENSEYVLGSRLLSLADAVGTPSGGLVAKAAQPHLDFVARSLGETSKISIYDRGHVLVIAVAAGTKPHALHARVGEQLPIHAGGSSKALFAFLPEAERRRIYSRPLTQYNDRTLFEPEALEEELARVRQQGWAQDPGEFTATVNSYAAPIRDRTGDVVAAVSIPFHAGRDAEYEQLIRATALATADRISKGLA